MILKADINGTKLKSINGSGSIKELHLSNNAEFSLNNEFEKALIDKGSMLTLFKQIDFKNLSGEGLVNINGTIYDADGQALNDEAYDTNEIAIFVNIYSVENNIQKYGFTVAKAIEKIKDKKDAYIDEQQQEQNIDLLNVETGNNDNLIWIFWIF